MGRMGDSKGSVRDAFRGNVLARPDTQEFCLQFMPTTPRRAEQFRVRLAALIESYHVEQEEQSLIDAARELAARGGDKGGPARAKSLSPEQRRESAVRAARARWHGERERQREAQELIAAFLNKRGRLPSRRAIMRRLNCSTATAARYLKAADAQAS